MELSTLSQTDRRSTSAWLVRPSRALLFSLADVLPPTAGSRRLNLDLVNADIDFTGTVPSVTNGPPSRLAKRSDDNESLQKRANPVKYSDVPVLGSVYSVGLPARDYRLGFGSIGPTGAPYSDYEQLFNGDYTLPGGQSAKATVGTSYRVLLRCASFAEDGRAEALKLTLAYSTITQGAQDHRQSRGPGSIRELAFAELLLHRLICRFLLFKSDAHAGA